MRKASVLLVATLALSGAAALNATAGCSYTATGAGGDAATPLASGASPDGGGSGGTSSGGGSGGSGGSGSGGGSGGGSGSGGAPQDATIGVPPAPDASTGSGFDSSFGPPSGLSCGGNLCPLGNQCCASPNGSTCQPQGSACTGVAFECEQSATCGPGLVCCQTAPGEQTTFTCQPGPCTVQSCRTSTECTNGNTCVPQTCSGVPMQLCGLSPSCD
jgi:hypothetical protein